MNVEPASPSNIPSKLWAVSHAWMAEENRQSVETIINNFEWPVPIPRDTTLEHVRIGEAPARTMPAREASPPRMIDAKRRAIERAFVRRTPVSPACHG